MATIIVNGCFDLLHAGHAQLLTRAKHIGLGPNTLIACINSDRYAKILKADKWGEKYPIDDERARCAKLRRYADEVHVFDNEDQLWRLIWNARPCIIVKGPDYRGKPVTGDDLAPVLILDTPETEEVREIKRKAYQRVLLPDDAACATRASNR